MARAGGLHQSGDVKRKEISPLSPCFRLCTDIGQRDGRAHGKTAAGEIQAVLRAVCGVGFQEICRPKNRVENQAGERVGAENGTRLGSLRTATPSVL